MSDSVPTKGCAGAHQGHLQEEVNEPAQGDAGKEGAERDHGEGGIWGVGGGSAGDPREGQREHGGRAECADLRSREVAQAWCFFPDVPRHLHRTAMSVSFLTGAAAQRWAAHARQ